MMYEIYEILEDEGYDVKSISNDEWDEHQDRFEDECDDYLNDAIESNKKTIIFEWATKLGLKKR